MLNLRSVHCPLLGGCSYYINCWKIVMQFIIQHISSKIDKNVCSECIIWFKSAYKRTRCTLSWSACNDSYFWAQGVIHLLRTHKFANFRPTPYAQIMTSLWQKYIGVRMTLDPCTPLRCVRNKWMALSPHKNWSNLRVAMKGRRTATEMLTITHNRTDCCDAKRFTSLVWAGIDIRRETDVTVTLI